MTAEDLFPLLDAFTIETTSWAYGGEDSRLGQGHHSGAGTIDQRLRDAGTVHHFTGCCPTVAVHVLWDFQMGVSASDTAALARQHGVRVGSVHPNLFQDQIFRYGSVCSLDERAQQHAHRHVIDSMHIARAAGSDRLSLWLADGIQYPGQDDLIARKQRMQGALRQWHDALPEGMTMLLEWNGRGQYHADVADWGMASAYCRDAGPHARVVIDAAPCAGGNIEQIVAFLIDEEMLGAIRVSDGSPAAGGGGIGGFDAWRIFRIFNEIRSAADTHGCDVSAIACVLDLRHPLKPKVEAMIQAVMLTQTLYARACLVDRERLLDAQAKLNLMDAEQCLRDAFAADVQPILREWRNRKNLAPDPLAAFRDDAGETERADSA